MIYPGSELALFSHADNWKAYWSKFVRPFIHGRVLEVGAGIGSSTLALSGCEYDSWTCLEPDPELASQIQLLLESKKLSGNYDIITGSLADIPTDGLYDTILYIDVLEHIEDEQTELQNAVKLLSGSGMLIILGPAHQWLYSKFDESIGHYRRYNKQTLNKVIPDELKLVRLHYLDSIGLFASLANRMLLKKSIPSKAQVTVWDQVMVRCSRYLDPLLFYAAGKSILGIWRHKEN